MTPEIIAKLRESALLHIQAIEVYSEQAVHLREWGYAKLAAKCEEDAKEEREHLDRIVARLEFLDEPVGQSAVTLAWPRHSITGLITSNLTLERSSAESEREGITVSVEGKDEGTAEVFRENLKGSEQGVQFWKAQAKILNTIGEANYLAAQI